jgi:hypothetical protein
METRPTVRSLLIFLALTGIIIALPLLGAMIWRDESFTYYLAFPPRLGGVKHASFSWGVFIGLAVLILACLLPFIRRAVRMAGTGVGRKKKDERRFPSWGYGGVALCAVAWILAWNRFLWFSACQPYTFPFLWIGYVIIVNALTYKRTGSCLLRERPVYFLALFPASALFWWFFEYLNRFVLNWYYVGIDAFGPWQYVFYASACFSTVLPAVLSTAELLGSVSFIEKTYRDFVPIRLAHPKASAGAVLIIVASTLFALALFPDILFPFLWISPLLCLVSFQTIAGREQIFSPLSKGDWTRAVSLAAAALVCGFFWEMWNFFSMPRWEYSIPYVHRCLIFEMPILGYAGYLPFGLECGAVGEFLNNMIPPRNGT